MKRTTFVMMAVVLAAWASAASANTVKAKFTSILSREAVHVHNGTENLYVWAGQSQFEKIDITPDNESNPAHDLDNPFGGYCVDLNQSITFGYTTTWELRPLEEAPVGAGGGTGSAMGDIRATLLRRLWANYFTDPNYAEFQVAVWEILGEKNSATDGYDVTDGTFHAPYSGEVNRTMINGWLTAITASGYSGAEASIVWALTSTQTQDFAVLIETITVPPGPHAPEPVTLFGLLAGVGGLARYVHGRRGRRD